MKPLLGAVALALALSATACSSDDGQADASSGQTSTAPTDDAATPDPPVTPLDGDKISAQYCVNAKAHEDWFWSGVQLHSDSSATVTRVRADLGNVDLQDAWVVPGANEMSPGLVTWSDRNAFLKELSWADRVPARGATLEAGEKYSIVLRMRPQPLPATLQNLEVDYRSGSSKGSLVNGSVLEFEKHC
jgi:hypothetical protein